jgi:peptidoglycan/LPS O-acetylase OafA/YrhL
MESHDRSRTLRLAATGVAAAIAALYALIGFSILTVVDGQDGEVVPPLVVSAALFAVLATLLARSAPRWLLVAGIVLQLLVLVGYVAIAPERTPAFEVWGLTQKVLQVGLLTLLVTLVARRRAPQGRPRLHLPV